MRRSILSRCLGAAALWLAAQAAQAQTQAQVDRMDELARYTVIAPLCPKLGFTLAPDAGTLVGQVAEAAAAAAGLDKPTAGRVGTAAIERQGLMLEADNRALDVATRSEAGFGQIKAYFLRYGQTCQRAAADPLFRRVVKAPAGFDLDKAATDAADVILAPGGYASWQTPAIQARGDLMTAAGGCRTQIGAARADSLYATYTKSNDPRARAYYMGAYDRGLTDTDIHAFTLEECERAIAGFTRKAGPP